MKKITVIISSAFLFFSFFLSRADEVNEKIKLWAAVSVTKPVFQSNSTENLQIFFALVNDGKTTVNPETDSSRLFINGKELEAWSFIVANGPRSMNYNALPPGGSIVFTYAMGNYFTNSGIYKVRWEGENFKTSEITFRVLPKPIK
ncbi:hypothetical protein P3T73_06875 [Kiritimatiellota bacterium B12222]|nr:hypothetical protein P3T73_06875 [Kiritimatiellota bacterium B12222]